MPKPETVRVRGVKASNSIDFSGDTVYGDFRDDIVRDGFAVIKGAIPQDRAAQYAGEFHGYLEEL